MSLTELPPRSTPAPGHATPARPAAPEHPALAPAGDMVQLLTPDGERLHHPTYDVDLSDDHYRGLYRDLVLVRRLDTEATALTRQGELALWPPLLGQEAAQVGAGRAAREQDFVFPTYREHGVALCRGVDPVDLMGLFRGTCSGGWDPAEHRFALYTIVIGSQTLHATGYAMGARMDGAVGDAAPGGGEAVLACFGDGATSQGDVNEAFVWASVYAAPVVFFCQNNHFAISESTDHQTRIPLYRRAEGFGFPGVRVDGNDVLATYAVVQAALDAARSGAGPTLVEAVTYRRGPHTTSDDPKRYRDPDEVAEWERKDPLARMRSFLVREGLADDAFFAQVDADADALAAHLRAGTLALPDPAPAEAFDVVYAEQTAYLQAQRDEFVTYAAQFEGQFEEGER